MLRRRYIPPRDIFSTDIRPKCPLIPKTPPSVSSARSLLADVGSARRAPSARWPGFGAPLSVMIAGIVAADRSLVTRARNAALPSAPVRPWMFEAWDFVFDPKLADEFAGQAETSIPPLSNGSSRGMRLTLQEGIEPLSKPRMRWRCRPYTVQI